MFTTNQNALMFTINQNAANQSTVARLSTVVQKTSSEVSSVITYELHKKVSVTNMLNKTPRVQKGEANQKQQLSDYKSIHSYTCD